MQKKKALKESGGEREVRAKTTHNRKVKKRAKENKEVRESGLGVVNV